MQAGYVIGMDGGGTGSKGITADLAGNTLFTFKGGATNYNGSVKSVIDANMAEVLEKAAEGLPKEACRGICIGSAGVSNREAVQYLEEAVRRAGYTCPVRIVADSMTAHAGALKNRDGIILIAGTGAICYGRKNGQQIRVGGYGHLIDDEGSAYDIARNILRAVVRAEDGRAEQTVLRPLVFEQLQIGSIEELIAWLYAKERTKKEIAKLAVLIQKAAEKEDPQALKIQTQAAKALAELCAPAVRFLGEKGTIALSGSVLQKNLRIRKQYEQKMQEHFPELFGKDGAWTIREAEREADYGAVLLALEVADGQNRN